MKKVLVIGSSVCDVIINVNKMPCIGEDENIISQSLNIGGCAFNVASMLKYFDIPFDLLSPIGKGVYGDFVRNQFIKENIPILLETDINNGCCYCIVDKSGERTFICEHGGEYLFKEEWFHDLNTDNYEYVYICGLEIEEKTGQYIIDFLTRNKNLKIIYAPSGRINEIDTKKMNRILSLSPILHLNEQEILSYTHKTTIEEASEHLYSITHNTIIVTLGDKGCYYYDSQHHYYQGVATQVIDTIGAGDSHIGTIIAMLYLDKSLDECMNTANKIASQVVSQKGARLK